MATGRTLFKNSRFYANGVDLSGYTRSYGPLVWTFEEVDLTCPMGDAVMGYLPGKPDIALGGYRTVLDPVADVGPHANFVTPGSAILVMVPIGIRAAPAEGDPVWCGYFQQLSYNANEDGGAMVVDMPTGGWDPTNMLKYEKPWGVLLHEKSAETDVNDQTGVDGGEQTTAGGYMVYHIFDGDGTATISIEDADTNLDGSFAALTGATTGELDCSAVQYGVVQLGTTATVERYVRWQIDLNTATTVTFALAFVRG